MEKKPHLGLGTEPKTDHPSSTIWEETKRRLQGAFEVLTGKSAAVDLQQVSELKFSHAIVQNDWAYSRDRNLEKDMEPER